MKDTVRTAFPGYTRAFEGEVPWMYLDIKGLVTIAFGNLIDPIQHAQGLEMLCADGSLATQAQIDAEWRRVKGITAGAKNGHRWIKQFTSLRMTPEGMQRLMLAKADQMVLTLRKRFPAWDTWPADAQLGTLSLAWACGPAFNFPRLVKSLNARDFQSAAGQSKMNTVGNPGLEPRNRAQLVLFRNAAEVERRCMDPETLYYPDAIGTE